MIYRGAQTLSRIASIVGIPLFVDDFTSKQSHVYFAQVMIEVHISKPLPQLVRYVNEKGLLVEQKVTYDWVTVFCSKC